jgi:hypothetical protein
MENPLLEREASSHPVFWPPEEIRVCFFVKISTN